MNHSKYKDISAKAEGDFLWAVLVTRFLLEDPPLVLDAYNGADSVAGIPNNLPGLVKLVTESLSCGKAAEYLAMAREAKRYLAAEILYFHNFDFANDMYAFMTPKELLSTRVEKTKELHHRIYRDIIQTCGGLLEVVDGQVVFVHRAVLELMHSEEFHNYLLTKARKGFDSDLSVFKASVSWFKRKCFRSGEFVDLQPEPAAVTLAYVKSLSKFHRKLGSTLPDFQDTFNKPVDVYWMTKAVNIRGGFHNVCKHERWLDVVKDLGYSDDTALSVSDPLKKLYKRWLHPYEEHLHQKKLEDHDPMKDIEDLVESLRKCLEYARRCDQKENIVATTWALLDNIEESLLSMTARNQFNISDLSMTRGIYRHLVIESGIQRYIANKLWVDPGYFDNKYSQNYRSRKYLSSYFLPDYPELSRQILMLIPGSDSRTIGFTTITSVTRDGITESIEGLNSTAVTSIELPEGIEVESPKDGAVCNSARAESDAFVDEVDSIQSIDEDIQSNNSSIARTLGTIAAERHIGDLLSQHPDLRFIIDISSELMPKERLERNIRRSLKLLYLKLREHAEKHIEIQVWTTRMLKGRGSRTRISKRTVDGELASLSPVNSNEEEEEIRPSFRKDRAYLNNWILKTELAPRPDEKPQQPADETEHTKLAESDDDISEEIQSDSEEFQAVQVAEEFLMKGPPFQAFLGHLGLSLLPDALKQVMQLATWDTIELIDTPAEVSLSDQIKTSVEKLTGSPWDWWPLRPPEVPVRRGYVRMNWACHCGKPFWVDITPSQARIIKRMTQNPTTFAEDHRKVAHTKRNAFQRVTAWFKWNSGAILPVSTPTSQGSQQSSGVGGNNRVQQGVATAEQNNIPPVTIDDLRILFGVPMGLKTLNVIPIPVNQPDSNVFPQLKAEYRRMRGRWRAWFSFWQLSHCNFVKIDLPPPVGDTNSLFC
ncbi:hypothetical protein J7337_003088 [Fusarium musae]|uniref:ARID domain-containing protein n=1 Tax=Fusarium musae TaxID=1042133 RepID=A0A9P8IUN6_9HYPO|nr:hypothetical protein J7337_003088 [Fusarium musae]KAG9506107.1 hypothetical protein J7337_003088 [Fusarium musae]